MKTDGYSEANGTTARTPAFIQTDNYGASLHAEKERLQTRKRELQVEMNQIEAQIALINRVLDSVPTPRGTDN